MVTPGQLIRQHRTKRGWSQRELAKLAGVSQATLSQYENELVVPTWQRLCRVLAPMGVQPTAASEPCDLTVHEATCYQRQSFTEWFRNGPMSGPLTWEHLSLDDLVRPNLTRSSLAAWDVEEASHFVDGLQAVFVGPFALRMHGFSCAATRLDIDLYFSEEEPDELSAEISRRCARDRIQLWSPLDAGYARQPSRATVEEVMVQTSGRMTLRTFETGTEMRMALCQGQRPATTTAVIGKASMQILAMDEFDREAPWVKHVLRTWIGPDEGAWPAGPTHAWRRQSARGC